MQKPMMDSPEMDRMQGFRRRPPAPGTNTGPVGRPPEGGAKGLGLGRLARLGRAFQSRPRPTQDQTGGGMVPGLGQAMGRMIRPPQPGGGPDGGPVARGMMDAVPGIARQMGLIRPQQPGPDGPPEMAPFAGAAAEQFQRQTRPMQRMELPPGPDGPPDVQKWDVPQQFNGRMIGGPPTGANPAGDFAAAAQKVMPQSSGPFMPPQSSGPFGSASSAPGGILPPWRAEKAEAELARWKAQSSGPFIPQKVMPQSSGPFIPNGPDDEQYRRMFMS